MHRPVRTSGRLRPVTPPTSLSDLEAKAKGATPGRWYAVNLQTHLGAENEHIAEWAVCDERNRVVQLICPPRPANASYIASASPDVILKLIAVARAAEAFAADIEHEAHKREQASRGGQHVPNHSRLAGAPPSTMIELQRWAREFRDALSALEERKP